MSTTVSRRTRSTKSSRSRVTPPIRREVIQVALSTVGDQLHRIAEHLENLESIVASLLLRVEK